MSTIASPSSTTVDESSLNCRWDGCSTSCVDSDSLYAHLCNVHVGRKSTGNLQLICRWNGCATSCSKRDHITSHLRVHIPLKPHTCDICHKSFKRPQDLKKHEKIHTEEHHVAHKHSKAVTVPSSQQQQQQQHKPAAVPQHPPTHPHSRTPSDVHTPPQRHSTSTPDDNLYPPYAGKTDRLSQPQWEHLQKQQQQQQQQQQQDELTKYRAAAPTATSSQKRSHESSLNDGASGPGPAAAAAVDGFFRDMKKRKYAPAYDADMVDRLSALSSVAFQGHRMSNGGGSTISHHHPTHASHPHSTYDNNNNNTTSTHAHSNPLLNMNMNMNMNPNLSLAALQNPSHPASLAALAISSLPSQTLPGSPEELAIVNNFLVRLGEEIAAGNLTAANNHTNNTPNANAATQLAFGLGSALGQVTHQHHLHNPVFQQQMYQPHLVNSQSTPNGYFDAATLAALGLINVPGVNSHDYGGGTGANSRRSINTARANLSVFGGQTPAAAAAVPGLNVPPIPRVDRQHQQQRRTSPSDVKPHHLTVPESRPGGLYPMDFLSPSPSDPETVESSSSNTAATSASSPLFPSHSASSTSTSISASSQSQRKPTGRGSHRHPSYTSNHSHSSSTAFQSPNFDKQVDGILGTPPTTQARNYGIPLVPTIAPMDSRPGQKVYVETLPLQSAPGAITVEDEDEDEEMRAREPTPEDDEGEGERTTFSLSHSRSSSSSFDEEGSGVGRRAKAQPLPPIRKLYPSLSEVDEGEEEQEQERDKVKLPSVALLISAADRIEEDRKRQEQEWRGGPTTYPSLPLSAPSSSTNTPTRARSVSSATGSGTPRSYGDDIPLSGLQTLALNRTRLSSPPPPSQASAWIDRVQHIDLIKAILVWVNTEYVKRHGDPWVQAEEERQREKSVTVGNLKGVQAPDDDITHDDDDVDELESEDSDSSDDDGDEPEEEMEVSTPPSMRRSSPTLRDVEMVASF